MYKIVIAIALFLLSVTLAHAQVTPPSRGGTGVSTTPAVGQVLVGWLNGQGQVVYRPQATSTLGITGGGGGLGTVTSVAFAVPTGFAIAGSPITDSGTLTLSFDTGYTLFKTASGTNWNNFFDTPSTVITAGTGADWSGNTLNVTLADFTTANLSENTNLYYTDARARGAISESILGLEYNSSTGVFSTTSTYFLPTTTRASNWDTAFSWGNHALSGYLTGNQTITLSGDASGSGATGITVVVADDSHAHTGSTLSGIDVSSDTNLSGDTEVVLTGDALSLGDILGITDITTTRATSTNATTSNLYASTLFRALLSSTTNASTTGFTASNANITNATSANLFATLGLFTNASSTYASSTSLTVQNALRIASLADGCLNITSGVIGTTGSACGAGGGGGAGTWSTTTLGARVINYSRVNTDIVVVGDTTGTSSAEYWFDPLNSTALITYASSTGLSGTNLNFTRSSTTNASTTGLTASQAYLNALTFPSFTGGVLTTNASGVVSASTTIGNSYLDSLLILSTEIDASSELAGILTDETGTGNAVFSAGPVFTATPTFTNLFVNTTGTTTLGYASTTALTVAGNAFLSYASSTGISGTNLNFTRSSTTNASTTGLTVQNAYANTLTFSTTTGGILTTNTSGVVSASTTVGNSYLDPLVILSNEIDTCSEFGTILTGQTTGSCGSVVLSTAPTFTGALTFAQASGTGLTSNNLYSTYASTTYASTSVLRLTSLYDSANSRGTNGMVLQSNGTVATWVATGTLGLGGAGGGTVTSVDMTVPTGLSLSGNPVTTSGTLTLDYASGYAGVLTASTTNWNTFYDTPSNRITAGTNLSWDGNTLNASGGGGGTISTSSIPVTGRLATWSSPTTLTDVATGTLSESITGLALSASRYLVGGASDLSLDSGYVIPTTTRLVEHDRAFASTTALSVSDSSTLDLTYTGTTGVFTGAVVADSIGDTQLAFNTGQNLTTASIPTFSALTLTNSSTLGYASTTALTVANNAYLNTYTATAGTTTNATSTRLYTTNLGINSEYFTDLTGTGLQNVAGVLTLNATGDWTGTLDGYEGATLNAKVATSSIDTIGEVETLWGVTNILIENDIDASSELLAIMDDETGTAGSLVFSTNPLFTGFRSSASSTIGDGTGVGGLTVNGTATTTNLKVTALTASRAICTGADSLFTSICTSQYLMDSVSDETGTGVLVFNINPQFTGFRSTASSTIGGGTGASGLTINGNSTTTGNALFTNTTSATSTLYIQSTGAGLGGRIILEDSDGAGCSQVTALDGVLTAITVTCP